MFSDAEGHVWHTLDHQGSSLGSQAWVLTEGAKNADVKWLQSYMVNGFEWFTLAYLSHWLHHCRKEKIGRNDRSQGAENGQIITLQTALDCELGSLIVCRCCFPCDKMNAANEKLLSISVIINDARFAHLRFEIIAIFKFVPLEQETGRTTLSHSFCLHSHIYTAVLTLNVFGVYPFFVLLSLVSFPVAHPGIKLQCLTLCCLSDPGPQWDVSQS